MVSWKRPDVVVGILQRPVRLEADVVVGRRQVLVDDAVRGTGRRPSRAPCRRRQSTSSARPDSVPKSTPIAYRGCYVAWFRACGSTTTFSPRRSRNASNASSPLGERPALADERAERRRGRVSTRAIARGRSDGCIRRRERIVTSFRRPRPRR